MIVTSLLDVEVTSDNNLIIMVVHKDVDASWQEYLGFLIRLEKRTSMAAVYCAFVK